MPHDRFFIENPLQQNTQVTLSGEESHHLMRVMRKQTGDQIELVNGLGQLAWAKVVKQHPKGVDLLLLSVIEQKHHLPLIILCQALPRSNRLDTIIEKGTELGMDEIWLFPGELSEKKEIGNSQLQRLKNIAIAATKQSGRLFLPKIIWKPSLSKWTQIELPAYFGETSEGAPPFFQMEMDGKGNYRSFFIGPEGGLTPKEKQHLLDLGAKGVSLHKNVLRVDTAALAALTLISHAKY